MAFYLNIIYMFQSDIEKYITMYRQISEYSIMYRSSGDGEGHTWNCMASEKGQKSRSFGAEISQIAM
jgi:hypothetical protein